jgi:hypothetical protein
VSFLSTPPDLARPAHYDITDHCTALPQRCAEWLSAFADLDGFVLRRNPDTVRAPDPAFVRTDRMLLK